MDDDLDLDLLLDLSRRQVEQHTDPLRYTVGIDHPWALDAMTEPARTVPVAADDHTATVVPLQPGRRSLSTAATLVARRDGATLVVMGVLAAVPGLLLGEVPAAATMAALAATLGAAAFTRLRRTPIPTVLAVTENTAALYQRAQQALDTLAACAPVEGQGKVAAQREAVAALVRTEAQLGAEGVPGEVPHDALARLRTELRTRVLTLEEAAGAARAAHDAQEKFDRDLENQLIDAHAETTVSRTLDALAPVAALDITDGLRARAAALEETRTRW